MGANALAGHAGAAAMQSPRWRFEGRRAGLRISVAGGAGIGEQGEDHILTYMAQQVRGKKFRLPVQERCFCGAKNAHPLRSFERPSTIRGISRVGDRKQGSPSKSEMKEPPGLERPETKLACLRRQKMHLRHRRQIALGEK